MRDRLLLNRTLLPAHFLPARPAHPARRAACVPPASRHLQPEPEKKAVTGSVKMSHLGRDPKSVTGFNKTSWSHTHALHDHNKTEHSEVGSLSVFAKTVEVH